MIKNGTLEYNQYYKINVCGTSVRLWIKVANFIECPFKKQQNFTPLLASFTVLWKNPFKLYRTILIFQSLGFKIKGLQTRNISTSLSHFRFSGVEYSLVSLGVFLCNCNIFTCSQLIERASVPSRCNSFYASLIREFKMLVLQTVLLFFVLAYGSDYCRVRFSII